MRKIKNGLKYLIFVVFFIPACVNSNQSEQRDFQKTVHKAHLSFGWYPQNFDVLNKELNFYFDFAKNNLNVVVDPNAIKALIVPHAGIYFSGLCVASVYQNLLENKQTGEKNHFIKKIIILSPSHVVAFEGISLPDYDEYQTVLGNMEVDQKSLETLSKNSSFSINPRAHALEHAIEIQLPFLQRVVEDFTIVPLVVGQIETNEYDQIIQSLKDIIDETTLVVISSDFTHYGEDYGYNPFDNKIFNKIRFVDFLSVDAIAQKSFDKFDAALKKTFSTICGVNAIKILLKLIENQVFGDIQARVSCYYTSSQIEQAREKNKINVKKLFEDVSDEFAKNSVSYAGVFFTTQKFKSLELKDQLTQYEKLALLKLARDSIKNSFEKDTDKLQEHLFWPVVGAGSNEQSGAFVTLNTKLGSLRGCIGQIVAKNPLYITIQQMCNLAAFNDTRFEPLKKEELENIVIDISVLTPPVSVASYKDIVIGKHGIILKKTVDGKEFSSVFLPQVPLSFGWNLKKTLNQLSIKAGLGSDEWKKDCSFEVFEGFEFKEN